MDELEKKELDGAEAKDELTKELEEIRDMFQAELDNASVTEEAGELIQETADVESCEEEEDAVICDCCGENPVSKQHGEDYPYCDECRELMKRYPLRKRGIIAIAAMILVFALSVFYGMDSFDEAIEVLDAKIYADSGMRLSAISQLYSHMSDSDPDSDKIVEILIDSFCEAGYLSDAAQYIRNVFTDEELEKASNRKYKEILDSTDVFNATQQLTESIVYDAFRGGDFDYEELAAQLDAVAESYYDEEKGIKHESILTEYYKYELMNIKKMDIETQLEMLKATRASDETGLYHWIYLAPLCEVAGKLGDTELAKECFEEMKENNCEDMLAYKAYAASFRYAETPDADAMIKLCEEAEENAYSGDTSYLPILATAYLIKEQGALAYETMQQYMSSNRYSTADCNLYALCGLYCGNTETYETMKITLESAGYTIGETVEKYKNGEISLAEVIADKRGDI